MLTIITPIYNRKNYLPKFTERLLAMSMMPTEIIFVDNGSTDGSHEWIKSFVHNHSSNVSTRLTVTREVKRGAPAARNKGLSLCTTPWVYFFDCDDEFDTNFVECAMSQIDRVSNDCSLIAFLTRMNIGGKVKTREHYLTDKPTDQIFSSHLNTHAMLFRTEWLRSIGAWDETLTIWQDWELGYRSLLHRPNIKWVSDRAFHLINIHPDSITGASIASNYEGKIHALSVAADITTRILHKDDPTLHRCLMALFLRSYILLGQLESEGNNKATAQCRSFIEHTFVVSKRDYQLGEMIELYVSRGGKSAWRIARWIVKALA